MSFRFAAAVTFALLLMTPSSGRTQVLTERNVSLHMALTIAETALAQCGVNTSVLSSIARAGSVFSSRAMGRHHTISNSLAARLILL